MAAFGKQNLILSIFNNQKKKKRDIFTIRVNYFIFITIKKKCKENKNEFKQK